MHSLIQIGHASLEPAPHQPWQKVGTQTQIASRVQIPVCIVVPSAKHTGVPQSPGGTRTGKLPRDPEPHTDTGVNARGNV